MSEGAKAQERPYQLFQRKGSSRWWMRFSILGQGQFRQSLGTNDEAAAERKAQELWFEANYRAKQGISAVIKTFQQVAEEFIEQIEREVERGERHKDQKQRFPATIRRYFIPYFGQKAIDSIGNYYADKRRLYLAASKYCLGEAARQVLQAADEGTSPRDRLFRFVRTLAMVDSNATRLFMRELVEVDNEGLALLENDSFEGAFRILIELLHQATGAPRSPSHAATVFALVLGLPLFSKFLEIGGGTELRLHHDWDELTEHVLQLVAPLS